MESHYDVAPSMHALKVCADHSISNNDSINTDIAAAAPVTGYAAQMIVMTQGWAGLQVAYSQSEGCNITSVLPPSSPV